MLNAVEEGHCRGRRGGIGDRVRCELGVLQDVGGGALGRLLVEATQARVGHERRRRDPRREQRLDPGAGHQFFPAQPR